MTLPTERGEYLKKALETAENRETQYWIRTALQHEMVEEDVNERQ